MVSARDTLHLMERLIDTHEAFFRLLDAYAESTDNDRKAIEKTPELLDIGKEAIRISTDLLEEFVFEGELFIIPEYDLKMVEEYLDQYILFHGIVHVPK